MEYHFGQGLVGLIHPVTLEFNHEAVIKRRGGRHAHESRGSLQDWGVPQVLGAAHGLVSSGAAEKWKTIGEKKFDQYDINSFFYGWILALQTTIDESTGSSCFVSTFESVTQVDYFLQDLDKIGESLKLFNLIIYTPTKIFNNLATAYQ